MTTTTLILATMTLCMVAVTYNAWRIGNDKRDVVMLGVISGLMGSGTALAAAL